MKFLGKLDTPCIPIPQNIWENIDRPQPIVEQKLVAEPDFSGLELSVPGTILKTKEIQPIGRVELEPTEQTVKTKPMQKVVSLKGLFEL